MGKNIKVLKAFITGGCVCVFAQFVHNYFLGKGISVDDAVFYTIIVHIVIASILTVFGLFKKIENIVGAGIFIPITGFANAIVEPSLEKKEKGNFFLQLSFKMFSLAAPVVAYGIISSVVVGIVYYIVK